MSTGSTIEGPRHGQARVCEPVLRDLPAWFGIEAAIQHYIEEIDKLPTFIAAEPDVTIGFLSIKQHFEHAAEIYVMAVRASAHRRGVGRALLRSAESWLRGQGVEFLQVKTVGPSLRNDAYDKTRSFYEALGFRPMEEFPKLWDEHNSCLIMVKALGG